MPDRTEFDQLASLSALIGERTRALANFREFLEPLQQGGLQTVDGESDLFNKLEQRLDSTFALLAGFADHSSSELIDQLKDVLNDVDWELADDLLPDLKEKFRLQVEMLSGFDADMRAWGVQVASFTQLIQGARFDGVPFQALEQQLRSAEAALASIRAAQEVRDYKALPALRKTAIEHVQLLSTQVGEQKDRIERVKKIAKQTDLLIMQVGLEGGDIEYRVLLRPADQEQKRGINIIQDVRKVSKVDREWLLEQLKTLTSSMNENIRSRHVPPADTTVVDAIAIPAVGAGTPRTISPAGATANASSDEAAAALARLGQFLFLMIIPDQVQAYLKREACSFSITTNDLQLPWELLSYEDSQAGAASGVRYLCLERSVSRMPLAEVFPTAPLRRAQNASGKPRMLLIHSDPLGNLPEAANEVDIIAQALADKVEFVRVNPEQATNTHINNLLTGPPFDFLHYAGHANFDAKNPLQSGLLLKDSLLTADKIRRLNKGGSLVFLNACESGTVARQSEPQKVSYLLTNPEPVVGLASAFVYSGATGCVGSLWPVYDKPAAELAVQFYTHVLAGEPTGEALRRARDDIRTRFPLEVTWAGYVLYGDPTFRLTAK